MGVPIFDKIKVSNANGLKSAKKTIEEKKREKSELYKYIGMEICDLWKAGRIHVQDLEVFFAKAKALEQEILEIEAEMQRAEMQKKGNRVCTCGFQLTGKDRFCPQCGKTVETGIALCACGQQLEGDMQFCPNCGSPVKSMGKERVEAADFDSPNAESSAQVKYKECICGAKVPEGQFMCMECGRKIEDN